jgi:hypothetical protein
MAANKRKKDRHKLNPWTFRPNKDVRFLVMVIAETQGKSRSAVLNQLILDAIYGE